MGRFPSRSKAPLTSSPASRIEATCSAVALKRRNPFDHHLARQSVTTSDTPVRTMSVCCATAGDAVANYTVTIDRDADLVHCPMITNRPPNTCRSFHSGLLAPRRNTVTGGNPFARQAFGGLH